MEFRHLEVFVAVADTKSFSKAADYLHLTQPTISSHIRTLEKELQTTLFHRTTKSLHITAEGECFLESARQLLALKDVAVHQIQENVRSIVRLGVSTIPSGYILPKILPEFRLEHPEILFDIQLGDSSQIEALVASGTLDLGFIGSTSNLDTITYTPFASDQLVLITPPLPYYKNLIDSGDLNALLQEPMIARERGSGTLFEAKRYLTDRGIDFDKSNIVTTHNDPESIKRMVANGMGISIFSKLAVADYLDQGTVYGYALDSGIRYFYEIHLVTKPLSIAAQTFENYVKSTVSEI